MRTILAILRRDYKRLVSVPSALLVAIGIIIIPTLYAWFNTIGFWDPYGNTQHIPVAIVNEDSGAHSDSLGNINLGKDIVNELHNNTQLGWFTTSHADAMDQVSSGTAQAAIIIPQNFSSALVYVVEHGNGKLPTLQYYVNEKTNAVAAKITDSGSTTIDRQVNNSFVSTASTVISKAINARADRVDSETTQAKTTMVRKLDNASQDIATLRDSISSARRTLDAVPTQTQQARESVTRLRLLNGSTSDLASRLSSSLTTTQQSLNTFTQQTGGLFDQGSTQLSQATSKTAATASTLGAALHGASATVDSSLTSITTINKQTADILAALQSMNLPTNTHLIEDLQSANTQLDKQIDALTQANTHADATVQSVVHTAQALNSTTQSTLDALNKARNTISTDGLSTLNQGMTTLAGATGSIAGGMQARNTLLDEIGTLLDQTNTAAASASRTLGSADTTLDQLQQQLGSLRTDIASLSTSGALSSILGDGGRLDTTKIGEFMLSPTLLRTHMLFPVTTYGSGMAPLFMNLALWVGAFSLVVIFKLETDEEDLEDLEEPNRLSDASQGRHPAPRYPTTHHPETHYPVLQHPAPQHPAPHHLAPRHLTSHQSFIAKYLYLAPFALAQGLLTAAGEIVIGVQSASAPAMIATAMLASLVYLAIIYALSTCFMHIGKGLCVALIMLQIPGSAGLYPIEMMPSFFKAMHPYFPFTHAVAAFRETIGGFYDGHWLHEMGIMLLFGVVFFAFGLVVRPRLVHVNRLFARELAQSQMVNMEPVLLRGREMRIQQVLRALADHDEFRDGITRRAEQFTLLYPKLKRIALIAGVIVPIIIALTLSFTVSDKIIVLAIWLVWFVIIIGALMTMEIMKDSIERQVALGNLSDDALLELVEPQLHTAHRRTSHHA